MKPPIPLSLSSASLLIPFFVLSVFLVTPQYAFAQKSVRPELRAFWADAFSPAFKSPEESDLLLKRVHEAHLNAVFVQMRKGGDAYYASRYEPWAKDDVQHFDALAYLVAKAHAMSPPIAVHAWINTCAVGGNGSNPFNIVRLHRDWLSLNPENKDFDDEATKIDPGAPGAADWSFRVYLDVARHYDVDGIHFDFVRYGGKDWGYNPISLARFEQRYADQKDILRLPNGKPDPADSRWKAWRREQVTNLVRKVYAQTQLVNPKIAVSAAVIAWGDAPKKEAEWGEKSAAMNRVYQDWRGWLQEGMIDFACPMTYFQYDNHADWQKNWSAFIKAHQYRRGATVAVGTWFNTIPQSLEMIRDARKPDPKGKTPYGVMLYCYTGTNAGEKDAGGKRPELENSQEFYAALSAPADAAPFAEDAVIPQMPWKSAPKAGHLKGFALTAQLDPVDGAKVELRGRGISRALRTDGTGFYAFVDLPPGSYALKTVAEGYQTVVRKVVIATGKVTAENVQVGGAAVPLSRDIASLKLASAAEGTPVRLENLTVVLGTDTFPDNLYAVDASGEGVRVRLLTPPTLPFQPGDVISLSGTLRTVESEKAIDNAKAVFTDMLPVGKPSNLTVYKGKDLIAGALLTGKPATLLGEVLSWEQELLKMDVDGTEVMVPLEKRKDFGVESVGFQLAPLPGGARVSASGILAVGASPEGKPVFILRMSGSKDLKVLPGNVRLEKIGASAVALASFFRNLACCAALQ